MEEFTYKIIRSQRRTAAIQILPDGTVVVRCPWTMADVRVREMVKSKEAWIRKALTKQPAQ